MSKDQRIPITILTGFLGSGKTTMLNHWVHQPEMKDCAVLINEFGSVGLDHELVQQVDNSVVLLSSGCICCTLQSSFVNSLLDLFKKALRGEIATSRLIALAEKVNTMPFWADQHKFIGIE